jgi:hypothetical protein
MTRNVLPDHDVPHFEKIKSGGPTYNWDCQKDYLFQSYNEPEF